MFNYSCSWGTQGSIAYKCPHIWGWQDDSVVKSGLCYAEYLSLGISALVEQLTVTCQWSSRRHQGLFLPFVGIFISCTHTDTFQFWVDLEPFLACDFQVLHILNTGSPRGMSLSSIPVPAVSSSFLQMKHPPPWPQPLRMQPLLWLMPVSTTILSSNSEPTGCA